MSQRSHDAKNLADILSLRDGIVEILPRLPEECYGLSEKPYAGLATVNIEWSTGQGESIVGEIGSGFDAGMFNTGSRPEKLCSQYGSTFLKIAAPHIRSMLIDIVAFLDKQIEKP